MVGGGVYDREMSSRVWPPPLPTLSHHLRNFKITSMCRSSYTTSLSFRLLHSAGQQSCTSYYRMECLYRIRWNSAKMATCSAQLQASYGDQDWCSLFSIHIGWIFKSHWAFICVEEENCVFNFTHNPTINNHAKWKSMNDKGEPPPLATRHSSACDLAPSRAHLSFCQWSLSSQVICFII